MKKSRFLIVGMFAALLMSSGICYSGESTAPAIVVKEPQNDSTIFENKVVVKGKVYNTERLFGITIQENRQIYINESGEFSATFTLPYAGNHYIKLVAYNKQNSNIVEYLTINYVKPQTRPSITIISPDNNSRTGMNSIRIKGYANSVKQVFIEKNQAKVTNKDNRAYFDEEVPLLAFGNNKFTVTAHTSDDKTITEELNIVKVQAYKPGQESKLRIFYPVNNYETPADKITVKGQGINMTKIYINDENIKLDNDKNFSAEIKLQYGANTIEIVGVGPNEVSIKELRNVIRLSTEMEKQKTQVFRVDSKDANGKFTYLDYVMTEKGRIEDKLTGSIQKIIDSILGPNKAIFSLVVNLNTSKIKNDLDKEFEGSINRFIQSIDCNVVVDTSSKQYDAQIRTVISQNLGKYNGIKQNYTLKYIDFSERKDSPLLNSAKVPENRAAGINNNKANFAAMDSVVVRQKDFEKETRINYRKVFFGLIGLSLINILMIAGLFGLYMFVKRKFSSQKSNHQSGGGAEGSKGQSSRVSVSDISSVMRRSEKMSDAANDGESKRFFRFIKENNIHKLKHVLGLQFANVEASKETIAIIVSYLDPVLASKVLMMYEPAMQAQIMDMLIEPAQYPAEDITRIQKEVKYHMDGVVGGQTHLLRILDNLSPKTTKSIFEELGKKHLKTFNSLKPSFIIFEDVLRLPDKDLEILLKEFEPTTIANSIKNSDNQEKDRVLSLLSSTGKEMVQEWLYLKGNKITDLEIEESHRLIISTAHILDNMGEIKLPKSDSGSEL